MDESKALELLSEPSSAWQFLVGSMSSAGRWRTLRRCWRLRLEARICWSLADDRG